MDTLSDVLRLIQLSSCVYFRSDFFSPWGMQIDQGEFAQFHIVTSGKCVLKQPGEEEHIHLSTGDIVVFPFGNAHEIADSLKSVCLPGTRVVESIWRDEHLFKDGEERTTLVCGHFEFNRDINHPLIKELPEFIYITNTERRQLSWLETATNVIMQEADSGNPGSDVVVERLAEVLFVQVLRAYMSQKTALKGYFAALQDPQINSALTLMHAKHHLSWTLEDIAKDVGMSRSSFASRFKQIIGISPMGYITNWRMEKARDLLKRTKLPLYAICEQVGYTSESSFSKAFKRQFNQNPGAIRRQPNAANI